MGITVAKASDLLSSSTQKTSLSGGTGTTTTRRSTGTKTASATSSRKSSDKEGNTFDALVKGHGTQDDNEESGYGTHGTGTASAITSDNALSSRSGTVTSRHGSQKQGDTTTQATASSPIPSSPARSSSNGDASSPAVTSTAVNNTGTDEQQSSTATSTVADMSQQVQTLQAWVAMAQAVPTPGNGQQGTSPSTATDSDNDANETSGTPSAGTGTDTTLSSNAAISALTAAMLATPALQSTSSGGSSPVLSQTGSSTATAAAGGAGTDETSTSTSAAATGIALALSSNTVMNALMAALPSAVPAQSSPSGQPVPSVSQTGSATPTVPDARITQVSSGSDNNTTATTGMDTLLAAVDQVTSGHVTTSGRSDTAAPVSIPAITGSSPSVQSTTQTDDTASAQQPSSQNVTVSNVVVATSSRADSRDSLAALSTATDYTASPAYNAVTGAAGEVAGDVSGTSAQNGLSDHSDNTGQEMDEGTQNTEARTPADLRLSTAGIAVPTSFTVEHEGNATDTQSVQMDSRTDDGEESGIRFLSSPAVSQSSDGTTSVSMTIMTADSTPVHVRLEGANGITTGVILESADDATSHHLASNRHELVTALGASGIDVGNLKIDVVTAADNNGNLNDQDTGGGAAYDGSSSGGMSGNGSGQNGGQSFAGNAWGGGFVQPGQIGTDMNGDDANGSLRSTMMNAGSGVNITA